MNRSELDTVLIVGTKNMSDVYFVKILFICMPYFHILNTAKLQILSICPLRKMASVFFCVLRVLLDM